MSMVHHYDAGIQSLAQRTDAHDPWGQWAARLPGSRLFRAISDTADAAGLRKIDAAGGTALARELQRVSPIISMQPLTELTSFTVFPGAPDQPAPFMETYLWKDETASVGGTSHSYAYNGQAADVQVQANTAIPILPYVNHTGWRLDEIARAMLGNLPLSTLKMAAVMRGIMQTCNQHNYFGNSTYGIKGFYTTAATPSVVANGAAGSPRWVDASFNLVKTPDEIEADIQQMYYAAVKAVQNVPFLKPNRLLISPTCKAVLASVKRSQNTDTTILQAVEIFLSQLSGDFQIVEATEANDNTLGGGDGTAWMALYRYDPMVIGRVVAQAPAFLPPDVESMSTSVVGHLQAGGLCVRYTIGTQIRYGMIAA